MMIASQGEDNVCLEILIASGLLLGSDKMMAANSEQPLHGHNLLSCVDRLSKPQDRLVALDDSDPALCRSGFADFEDRDVEHFAEELGEGIAALDGRTQELDLLSTFSPDNTAFSEETADGSPDSQTNSDGSCDNFSRTKRSKGRGRPVKASDGVTSIRTIIQCSTCRKTFNNSSALAKHKLIHSTERKYTCTLCTKAFKRQDHLNGHLMTHCSKKPYECKFFGCDKSYCDVRSLRRHHDNHHQPFLDGSVATGSDASLTPCLTPGLTPGAGSDSPSGIFCFDFPCQDQGLAVRGEVGRSPSPLSPYISISPSPVPQKSGAWTLRFNPFDEPKLVQCAVCDRRFRNMAALNGHMRLHGGYPFLKRDVVETATSEDSSVSTNKMALSSKTDRRSSSFGMSGGQLSKASSCSALPTTDHLATTFSPVDVVVQKQEEGFAHHRFASSDISDSLIHSLCPTLERQNQRHDFDLKNLDVSHDEHVVDQSQVAVDPFRLVDNVGRQRSLDSTGQNWSEETLLTVTSSSGLPLDGGILGQKFVPSIQNSVISRHFQRLLITVPSPMTSQEILSDAGVYGHMTSSTSSYTNPNVRFAPVSLTSPACNIPTTPTVITGKNGHPTLLKNHPLTPSYAVTHPPSAPLSLLASASYRGNHTPCTPPYVRSSCSQISGPSQMSDHSVFFQFPSSQLGDEENSTATHSSAPNLPSYGAHPPPRTPQTPHSPFTSITPKYTPNGSTLAGHFQFPPSANFLEGSSSCGSPYPHHHSKSYHPYSRPPPASPRYQQQEDIFQVEQKIHGYIQHLQQEDLKRQQMCLETEDCIAAETICRNFPILDSMFDDESLGNRPAGSLASSAEMREYFEGIDRESVPFDVEMELTSSCPVMSAIDPSELSALFSDQPDAVPAGGVVQGLTDGEDEVMRLLREQLGDTIGDPDLGVVGGADVRRGSVTALNAAHARFGGGAGQSRGTGPAAAMDLMVSPRPHGSANAVVFDSAETEASVGACGTSETEKRGRKHRPEPLHIPPNVNSYGYPSRLRSPRLRDSARINSMPYTPPPMISPARNGSGVFGNMFPSAAPHSAPPYNHNSRCLYGFEENGKTPETDILPHVNIGPEFQADIPYVVSMGREMQERILNTNDELLWDPKTTNCLSEEELRRYQEFICCAPILGNGTNKEEALHLLQRCNGSTKMAILKLMTADASGHKSNSNGNFKCKVENDRWKADEIEQYHRALVASDKDFTEIAKEVGSKSVKQCVKFYYVWKKIFGDDYRVLSRKRSRLLMEACSNTSGSTRSQAGLNASLVHRSSDHGL